MHDGARPFQLVQGFSFRSTGLSSSMDGLDGARIQPRAVSMRRAATDATSRPTADTSSGSSDSDALPAAVRVQRANDRRRH